MAPTAASVAHLFGSHELRQRFAATQTRFETTLKSQRKRSIEPFVSLSRSPVSSGRCAPRKCKQCQHASRILTVQHAKHELLHKNRPITIHRNLNGSLAKLNRTARRVLMKLSRRTFSGQIHASCAQRPPLPDLIVLVPFLTS